MRLKLQRASQRPSLVLQSIFAKHMLCNEKGKASFAVAAHVLLDMSGSVSRHPTSSLNKAYTAHWNRDAVGRQDCGFLQELLDVTHSILGELEKEHKAQKAPGATAEAAKPDADADELREKLRIVRVSPPQQNTELLCMMSCKVYCNSVDWVFGSES